MKNEKKKYTKYVLTQWPYFAERLQASVRLLNRIKMSFNKQLVTESATTTTVASEHISTTADGAPIIDNEDSTIELATEAGSDTANTEWSYEKGNYFYRRKCQMVDDWGTIGLNCTEEDIVTERVEVVGFLANWLHTYLHIRSEFEILSSYAIPSMPFVQLRLSCVTNRSFCSLTHTHTHIHPQKSHSPAHKFAD